MGRVEKGAILIWGLVLAAGSSTRFGRPKLVHPFGGEPLIRRSVAPLQKAGLPVMVVIAPAAGDVRGALEGSEVTLVENEDAAEGVASSIRCGIRALPAGVEAVVILPGDQPDTPEALIRSLVATFHETGAEIVSPRYRGTLGPPVLFSRSRFPALSSLTGDRGARAIIEANAETTAYLNVDQPVPRDVDTPEDLDGLEPTPGRGS